MLSEKDVLEIKRKHSWRLLQKPGVSGVGVEKDDSGRFVLTVHLDPTQSAAGADIPDSIEGVPVRRLVSGPFVKQ
jgi:hypothetical protein